MRTIGEPVEPVEVLMVRRSKVRVRFLKGDLTGLVEWVSRVKLVIAWDEAAEFMANEQQLIAALEATAVEYKSVSWQAVDLVFRAIPDVDFGFVWRYPDLLFIANFESAVVSLGEDPAALRAQPSSFIDRHGEYIATYQTAEQLARRLCLRFGETVLCRVRAEQNAYQDSLLRPPPARALPDVTPVLKLVRAWCGTEAVLQHDQLEALRDEVKRLRDVIEAAARWMVYNGHAKMAATLEKAITPPAGDP